MLRHFLLANSILTLMAGAAFAQEHEHEHETAVGALIIVHPWARAASAGSETLVFFEIGNAGEAVTLLGAESDVAASVEIVGAQLGAEAERGYQPVGEVTISPGEFAFDPDGLGLLLTGLTQDLQKGDEFEHELEFSNGEHAHLHVEVEAADAVAHSHAGHSH